MKKRIVIILVIIGAVLGILVASVPIGIAIRSARMRHEIERELKAIKAKGDPVQMSDLIQPAIPDAENAAVVYRKAFAAMKLTEKDNDFISKIGRGLIKLDDPGVMTKARTLWQRNQQALDLIHQATQMSKCDFEVDWERGIDATFPHLAKLRQCSRLLAFQQIMLAREGRVDEALVSYQAALRITAAANDPVYIGWLVKCAIISISHAALQEYLLESSPSPEDCRYAAREISRIDLQKAITEALKGERAQGIWLANHVYKAKDPIQELGDLASSESDHDPETTPPPQNQPRVGRFLFNQWLLDDELFYLKAMDRYIKDSSLPYRVVKGTTPDIESRLDKESNFWKPRFVSSMMLPLSRRPQMKRDSAQSLLDLDRITLLLKAYHADHGAYPATLADLAKAEKVKLPEDPFSGKPYTYRREEKGFLLYGWGPNLLDDGGQYEKKYWEKGDMVVRFGR